MYRLANILDLLNEHESESQNCFSWYKAPVLTRTEHKTTKNRDFELTVRVQVVAGGRSFSR